MQIAITTDMDPNGIAKMIMSDNSNDRDAIDLIMAIDEEIHDSMFTIECLKRFMVKIYSNLDSESQYNTHQLESLLPRVERFMKSLQHELDSRRDR